jgi:hypothetical protein
VVYFTRATARRIVGALAGGVAAGCFGLGAIVLGNALGLWRVPIARTPYFGLVPPRVLAAWLSSDCCWQRRRCNEGRYHLGAEVMTDSNRPGAVVRVLGDTTN